MSIKNKNTETKCFHKNRLIVLLGFLFVFSPVFTQDQDFMLWSKLGLKYEISKKTRLSFEEEFRFYENASRLEQNHTEIGVRQKLSDKWDGGVFYRFIYETDPEKYYSLSHRAWMQIAYKWQWGQIKGSVRERLQSTFQDYLSSKNGKIPDNKLRSKLSFSYKPATGKIEPYVSTEFWYGITTNVPCFIDKFRIGVGLEYKQNRNVQWSIFYNYQKDIQVASPDTGYIFGIAYTYLIR